MDCPKCGGPALVVDSRHEDGIVRRKRHCSRCEQSFKTLEYTMPALKKVMESYSVAGKKAMAKYVINIMQKVLVSLDEKKEKE